MQFDWHYNLMANLAFERAAIRRNNQRPWQRVYAWTGHSKVNHIAHTIFALGATVATPGTWRPNSPTNISIPLSAAELSESAATG